MALPIGPIPVPVNIPPLPGGNVIPFPVGPQDAVDLNEGEAIAEVFKIGASAELPATAAVAEIAIPLYVGIKVETALLENQHWDNFWIGAGGKLNDLWHSASDFLFGNHGVSLDTVSQMLQLSAAQSRRFTRQLVTKLTAYAAASQATVQALGRAVGKGLHALDVKINNVAKLLSAEIANALRKAEAYTDAKTHALRTYVDSHVLQVAGAVEDWAKRNIYAPLHADITAVSNELHGLEHSLGSIIDARVHSIVDSPIAHLTELVGVVAVAVAALEKEATECGEPMCETVGPKTDWGKWLKKFGPTAIWLMLAEVAAQNPQAVEDAAEGLAAALGPVLSTWVEQWALGGNVGFPAQPGAGTKALGSNPLE